MRLGDYATLSDPETRVRIEVALAGLHAAHVLGGFVPLGIVLRKVRTLEPQKTMDLATGEVFLENPTEQAFRL